MIDPNKQYQTRDGLPVRIYAVDGAEGFPVHGAASIAGGWRCLEWKANGDAPLSYGVAFDLIPLPDWRDEIPWEAIRPEYRWVARDDDGNWWAFERQPNVTIGCWSSISLHSFVGTCIAMPAGPDDWREAIAKRPEGR